MSEDLGKFIGFIVVHIILTLHLYLVDRFVKRCILPRRPQIVYWGRRTQSTLHIPERLHIFSVAEPGILDEPLRNAVMMLSMIGLISSLGLLAWCVKGTFRDPVVWVLGFAMPAFCMLLLWLGLIIARRRFESLPWDADVSGGFKEGGTHTESRN
ncbi:uncharacterized protein F4822DRAFT_384501 [Hypoxylon trugodes]|uniref:uncharacterized protein n=1 Tax=Hypoxylon trugodes TaxID=326681 RepID=UPI0021920EBD|nr:uncharacterized protein F4822DRAFT_384501 [Hypoxylon trugodes]KAI1393392.1 hypothetical protein F4822DRAFT_384501 [Hypoxylon trugodes]